MRQSILQPTCDERQRALAVARTDEPADLLLKNARVLDLVNGEIILTNIALSGRFIAGVHTDYTKACRSIDLEQRYVSPGFIDSHVHIESSLMHPFSFEACTLKRGTTAVIADPHEITNVFGHEGFAWMLRCAERMFQHVFVQVPSSVPSKEGMETNGGPFTLENMLAFKDHPNLLGLGEVMNVPAVISGDVTLMEKLDAFAGRSLDGHAPMVRGTALNAYRFCGIGSCHESVQADEALEKLRYGMALMLREGSAAKNLDTIAPVVTNINSHACLLCTDDRNPLDISESGHIDGMILRLIQEHKMDPLNAYRMASYSAARYYGLHRLGLIASGYLADLVILDDLEQVKIHDVYVKGNSIKTLDLDNTHKRFEESNPPLQNSIKRLPVDSKDLEIPLENGKYRVIDLIPREILTRENCVIYKDGFFDKTDVLPINVIERYGHHLPPAKGLVRGFGLSVGAIATSIAHDCHNLIVIGEKAEDRATAVNRLITLGGGIVAVKEGVILEELPLTIAGLMSIERVENIATCLQRLRMAAKTLGCTLDEPYLHMAFLALPVIPELKLTDKGLIRSSESTHISLRVD